MIRELPYSCKMCGTNRVAEYDDDCAITRLDSFKAMLTCPRCYEYFDSMRRANDIVRRLCLNLYGLRNGEQDGSDRLNKVTRQTRLKLTAVTKRLVTIVNAYYGQQNQWEETIVDTLIDCPQNYKSVILHMRKMAKPV